MQILLTDICRLIYYSFEQYVDTFKVSRTHPETCTIDFDSYKLIKYIEKQIGPWETDENIRHITIVDLTRMSISPDFKKEEYGIYHVNLHIAIPSNTKELKRLFDTLQKHDTLKYATDNLCIDRIEFTDKPATYFLQFKVRYIEEEPQMVPRFIGALADYYDTITIDNNNK